MKETPVKDVKEEDKVEEGEKSEENINNIVENLQELKIESGVSGKREPSEDVDESKILNTLSDDVEKLNIQPGEGEEAEDDNEGMLGRGPTGGVEMIRHHLQHTANKPLPMRPLQNRHIFSQQQYLQQPQVQNKNGRRSLEDAEENEPGSKFMNPDPSPPSYPHGQFTCLNNLSQRSGPLQMMPNFPMTSTHTDFQFGQSNETQMYYHTTASGTSGCKMIVTSPVYGGQQDPFGGIKPNIADDLLDEIERPGQLPTTPMSYQVQMMQNQRTVQSNIQTSNNANQQRSQVNPTNTANVNNYMTMQKAKQQDSHPQRPPSNMSYMSSNSNDHMGSPYQDHRRFSDPSDSGVESAEERSPYSDPAPSPTGSTYTSPPSVDSGFGGPSPQHETNFQTDFRSPMVPGMSPAYYRTTPSPSSSCGNGSPLSQMDDAKETIEGEREEELEAALQVINEDLEQILQSKRKESISQQTPITTAQQGAPFTHQILPNTQGMQIPSSFTAPQQSAIRPMAVAMPGQQRMPTTMMQQNIPVTGLVTTTSSAAHQQIIFLSANQQSNQPVILVPVPMQPNPLMTTSAKKTQPPKKIQPRKILPKMPNSISTGSNGSPTTTSVSQSGKPGGMTTNVTMTTPASKAAMQQQDAHTKQQDRLLMIARRTVADIPRDHLRRADDEGDTYLHIAVCKTDRYMVQALLERLHRESLDHLVDQENNKRQTPLYLAVFINQPVMVAMFIKFKADVNVLAQNLSADGSTTEVKAAIHVAASLGRDYHNTLVELLKAKDISINIVNNYGQTALHCAILAHGKAKRNSQDRIDSIANIQTLIKAGADPSAQDKKSGKTPLMYAIEQRNLELVQTILSTVDPTKVKNVVKTQAFDGSSCLKIAEGLKDGYNVQIWNRLWNSLQSAANGSAGRMQQQPTY